VFRDAEPYASNAGTHRRDAASDKIAWHGRGGRRDAIRGDVGDARKVTGARDIGHSASDRSANNRADAIGFTPVENCQTETRLRGSRHRVDGHDRKVIRRDTTGGIPP
jgi:hypothetical protein